MKYQFEVVSGAAGKCLSFGDEDGGTRISGPKPWGGGGVEVIFPMDLANLEELKELVERAIEMMKETDD